MTVARQYHRGLSDLKRRFGSPLLYFSLSFFLLSIPPIPLQAQVNSQRNLASAREQQDYTFAFGLYSDKMYELAAEQFDQFLEKYPTSLRKPDALFLRSECSFFMKEYDRAVDGYTSYLKQYSTTSLGDDAQFRIGQSELARGRYEQSVAAFKSVVDTYADSPLAGESAYWLGEAYDRSGDMNNAVKYFTLSYEHFRGNPYKDYALYAVGWTYQKNGKYDDAKGAYEKLLTSEQSSALVPSARVRIGECLFSKGNYQGAVDYLAPVIAQLPDSSLAADAEYTTAESFYLLQKYDLAVPRFRHIVAIHPGHARLEDAIYGLAWTYLKKERYDSAAASFQTLALAGGARAHEARYRYAVALREAGRTDTARSAFLSVVQTDPEGQYADDALVDAADLSLRAGDREGAARLAARVVSEYPKSNVRGDALWMLGEISFADEKFDQARRSFVDAARSPVSGREITVTSSFKAALAAYRLAAYDTAASEFGSFRAAYAGHPKVPEAAYWQAESEYKLGKFTSARALYAQAAQALKGKEKNDALYGLGWSSYKEARYADAVEAFGQLISGSERSPVDYDARMRQADALYAMKEYLRAQQAYRAVVRLYPDTSANDIARYQAAQCAFRREDLPGAYSLFQELVKLMPSSPLADDAQYAMGWINFRRKEYSDAIKDFQVVIRSFPSGDVVPRAYYSLADGFYNLKQYPAAEKAYREVITKFPESQYVPDAITGLQYCLVALGKESEAVTVIDQFLAEHAGSPSAQALLLKKAELLYSNDQLPEARAAYQDFVARYPSSSLKGQAYYWLGKTELNAGNKEAAYAAFRSAWDLPGTYRGMSLLEALDAGLELKKTEDALSLILGYERSLSPAEIRADVALRKAQLFRAEGNEEDAQRQFERVVLEHPTDKAAYEARIHLSRIALGQKDAERARVLAREVAGARTDDLGAEGQFLVGQSYMIESRWRDAATSFLRVKYVYPSSREWNDRAALGLATAYRSLGETEKAKQTLREFLKGSPDAPLRSEGEALLKAIGG